MCVLSVGSLTLCKLCWTNFMKLVGRLLCRMMWETVIGCWFPAIYREVVKPGDVAMTSWGCHHSYNVIAMLYVMRDYIWTCINDILYIMLASGHIVCMGDYNIHRQYWWLIARLQYLQYISNGDNCRLSLSHRYRAKIIAWKWWSYVSVALTLIFNANNLYTDHASMPYKLI